MPLTAKGKKILSSMTKAYKKKTGDSNKGKQVFHAMIAEGKLKGVEGKSKKKAKKGKKK